MISSWTFALVIDDSFRSESHSTQLLGLAFADVVPPPVKAVRILVVDGFDAVQAAVVVAIARSRPVARSERLTEAVDTAHRREPKTHTSHRLVEEANDTFV